MMLIICFLFIFILLRNRADVPLIDDIFLHTFHVIVLNHDLGPAIELTVRSPSPHYSLAVFTIEVFAFEAGHLAIEDFKGSLALRVQS